LDDTGGFMDKTTQRVYVYCGLLGVALAVVGLIVAHLVPPPDPSEGAA
jgi:hypothetical protein